MLKILLYWIFLIGMLWNSSALAGSGIMISAIESSAWMQQGETKTALATGDEIGIETRVVTGSSGKLAMQLDLGASFQLDVDSEIELLATEDSETSPAGSFPAIKIHLGRACAQYRMQPDKAKQFNLLLGDSVKVTIRDQGQICVSFNEDLSSIVLNKGSVQITNLVEPAMVVLSEEGSEYRFDDTGYFELDKVETAFSIEVGKEAAAKPGTQTLDQTTAGANEVTGTTVPGVSQPVSSNPPGTYVYTVYLFSTRSQEVANEVNQKLTDAGHETLIISSEDGTATRYRIAVSGFASRKAAQDFAAAIVGNYGIADTWIGRQKTIQ